MAEIDVRPGGDVPGPVVLAVPALFAVPGLAGGDGGASGDPECPTVSLRETYHDAPDLRLIRSGVTLCHLAGELEPRWELRLPDGAVEVEPGSAADETVPARLRELLTAHLRDADLGPVAVLRTERTTRLLHTVPESDGAGPGAGPPEEGGEPVAEVLDETVSVLDGRRVAARFRELVVRSVDADVTAALVARLTAEGAVVDSPPPRLVRALGPRAAVEAEPAPGRALGPTSSADELVGAGLRAALAEIVAVDPGVRRDQPDAVHRMRVACRRLRSDLATVEPLLFPEAAAHLRGELRWLGNALGGARDLEVLRARLRRTAVRDPVAPLDGDAVERLDGMLALAEHEARDVALEALRSDRYRSLLDGLAHWSESPPTTEAAAAPCVEVVRPLVAAAWGRLVRAAGRLDPQGDDESWHAARLKAKRARYAAEALVPVLGAEPRRLAKALRGVQDVLGEHQDAAAAAERVLDLARDRADDVRLAVTVGRLAERERAAVLHARAAFPAVWKAASRRKAVAWLSS